MQLVRHSRRPEWGLGLVVRELAEKAEIVFEDGTTRTLLRTLEFLHPATATDLAENSPLRVHLAPQTNGHGHTRAQNEARQKVPTPVLLKALRSGATSAIDALVKHGSLDSALRREVTRGLNDICNDLGIAVRTTRGRAQIVSETEVTDAVKAFGMSGIIDEIKSRVRSDLDEDDEARLRRYVHTQDAEEDLDAIATYLALDEEARFEDVKVNEFTAQVARRTGDGW